MRQYLMPLEVGRELPRLGFHETAKTFGLTIVELNEFIEKHGTVSAEQVDLVRLFPTGPKKEKVRRTPQDIQKLLDAHGREETALLMGITLGTLNNYISQMKLHAERESRSVPTREELAPLVLKYTFREIADIYGVTETTVSRWVRRTGLKSRRDTIAKHDFRTMLVEGMPLPEIAEKTGFSVETILKNI